MHRQLLVVGKSCSGMQKWSMSSKWTQFFAPKIYHLCRTLVHSSICRPNGPSSQKSKQKSFSRISTFKWASASSSWLELEGEGVADLLPGGEGEPWGSAPRLTCRFSCVSALMGLGSIGGELFIRAWLRLKWEPSGRWWWCCSWWWCKAISCIWGERRTPALLTLLDFVKWSAFANQPNIQKKGVLIDAVF